MSLRNEDARASFARLLECCNRLPFERHDIASRLDFTGHYREDLEGEFPLLIRLFHYASGKFTPGVTWHERLEVFVPLDRTLLFRMGDQTIPLEPGDVLIVDNLKPHHVVDYPGFDSRAIVISFMPDLVYSLGVPAEDYVLLLPFYCRRRRPVFVVRRDDAVTPVLWEIIGRLLECYYHTDLRRGAIRRTGCKAHLLRLLFHLAERCEYSEALRKELVRHQERLQRFRPLLQYISRSGAHGLNLAKAADMVGMSRAMFTRCFKQVGGMTFTDYLHHVRMLDAARLLRETTLTMSEIAHQIGYSDLGYFDRRFKRSFGESPRKFREIGQLVPSAQSNQNNEGDRFPKFSPGVVTRTKECPPRSGLQRAAFRMRRSELPPTGQSFQLLREVCSRIEFDPHQIKHLLDATGRYDEHLDPEYPFTIRFFHYTSRNHTRASTWHERLELFLVLDGSVRFQMGEHRLSLSPGELLVVDNLKPHRVIDFPGFDARVVVISFMPEFIYTLGSPANDYYFLLPFRSKVEGRLHLLRPSDPTSEEVYRAITDLVRCFQEKPPFHRVGCRVILLELLHHLAVRFESSESLHSMFLRQQEEDRPLQRVLEYIQTHLQDRLQAGHLTRLAGMSAKRFRSCFRRLTGMTFGQYVRHVRVNSAARLLQNSERTVAEIAAAVGFSDQSYLDRCFREEFGTSPSEYRMRLKSEHRPLNPKY